MGKSVACLKDRVTWTAAENSNPPKAAKIPYLKKRATLSLNPALLLKFLIADPNWCSWTRCWAYIIRPVSSPYSREE